MIITNNATQEKLIKLNLKLPCMQLHFNNLNTILSNKHNLERQIPKIIDNIVFITYMYSYIYVYMIITEYKLFYHHFNKWLSIFGDIS